jgi:signal transduction histidine kinase
MQVGAVDSVLKVSMVNTKNKLFCRLDNTTPKVREQQRLVTLQSLGLLEANIIPVFDEATQSASRFLETPICILGLMLKDQLLIKSAVGLSRAGLMNQLATTRSIPKEESFCTYVVDSSQDLIINNTTSNSIFVSSALVQHYGIAAYLGTPLMTAEGQCIGTLAVMDLETRNFSAKDAQYLAMTARWCLREFERDRLSKSISMTSESSRVVQPSDREWETRNNSSVSQNGLPVPSNPGLSTNAIKVKLLEHLTQELRTPLTSVIGMASVLRREVYGPLTLKQKEYLEIIHNSGQHLISLAEEIIKLGVLEENSSKLQLAPVDIEMLCQQALNNLLLIAKQQRQEIRLSVEPGNRIWLLDKDKIRQILYYLIINALESAEPGSEIHIHVSRRNNHLNIAVWTSHPWLGDGLPQVELYSSLLTHLSCLESETSSVNESNLFNSHLSDRVLSSSALATVLNKIEQPNKKSAENNSRKLIGLLLACHLAELHEGTVALQGSSESGYRYVLKLPEISAKKV